MRAQRKKLFCERREGEKGRKSEVGGGKGERERGHYNTALQVEAIEKPVWLKGSGLGRIRDVSSYRRRKRRRKGVVRMHLW